MKVRESILLISLLLFSIRLYAQKSDSLFANSLFYNSIYDDNSFIDSTAVANLHEKMINTEGEEKVGHLFKLLNGFYFYKPNLSKKFGEQALKISIEIENDSLTAYSYHYTGLAYNYLGYKRLALNYYSKGLETKFAKKTDNYRSWVTFNSGIIYFELGEPDTAAQYLYEAIRINEKVGSSAFASKVYLELAKLFFSTKNYNESIRNFRNALQRIDLAKDKRVAAQLFEQRFKIAVNQYEIDSADFYFNSAITMAFELNDSSLISEVYYEYANQLFDNEYYSKALMNFETGVNFINLDYYPREYFSFLLSIGKSNLYLDNVAVAKKQISEAIKGFSLLPDTEEKLYEVESTLAQLYAKIGDWEKYKLHSKRSEDMKSAYLRIKELHSINELKTIYETEKKDQQIKYQDLDIASKEKQIWLLGGIIFVVVSGLLLALKLSKKLKHRNEDLYNQNIELSKRWNELQGFYMKCTPPEDETKESKTLFQKIIKLFNAEKSYKKTDLTVEYLAKRFSSNVKYISASIKDQTGMNFNTFVNTYRIEFAKELIKAPKSDNLTLEAIAEECGFNNQTSFYQAFKKNTGLTPSQYRNVKVA